MPLPASMLAPQQSQSEDSAMRRLLRDIGHTTASGASVVANTLNKPSRALWGSLNYLAGGDSGGGLLNLVPFSDTMGLTDPDQGIEASKFLANQGVISQNDPTKWEAMDFVRGGLDVAGDPLSYAIPLGLTTKGIGLAKTGGLSKGLLGQIGAGERGLVGFQMPFAATSRGAIGTGKGVASALQATGTALGKTPVLGPAAKGLYTGVLEPLNRWRKAAFDASVQGAGTAVGQESMAGLTKAQRVAQRKLEERLTIAGQKLDAAGLNTAEDGEVLRHVLETGTWLRPPKPVELEILPDLLKVREDVLKAGGDAGLVTNRLQDPAKIDYWARQVNKPGKRPSTGRASPSQTGDKGAKQRLPVYQGFQRGTKGVNDLFRDADFINFIEQSRQSPQWSKAKFRRQTREDLAGMIEAKYGKEILRDIPVLKNGQPVLDPVTKLPVTKNRYDELAKRLLNTDALGKGRFVNHPLVDAMQRFSARTNRTQSSEMLAQTLAKQAGSVPNGVTLGKIVELANKGKTGIDRNAFLDKISEIRTGRTLTAQYPKPKQLERARNALMREAVDPAVAKDITRNFETSTLPEAGSQALKALDSYSNLWKGFVLSKPSRITRDLTGGLARAWDRGWLTGEGIKNADALARGQKVSGLENIPAIRDLLIQQGLAITPENAEIAYKASFGARYRRSGLFGGDDSQIEPGLEQMLSGLPGQNPQTPLEFLQEAGQLGIGMNPATGKFEKSRGWPLNVRGVGGRTESTFAPVAAADKLGSYADSIPRMASDIELLKQGFDPDEAARKVNSAFVDYSKDAMTKLERDVLQRAIPFYRFIKGSATDLAQTLAANPGGRSGQLIRGVDRLQGDDPTTPEYVKQSSGIPLGQLPDGSNRFITGLGLMQEAPLGFLGGGLQGALLEGMSSLNPIAKGGIEWGTGESLFQRSPLGGRDLGDLDPTIGRLLSNVGESVGLREKSEGPVRFPGQTGVEYLAGASPLGPWISTARMLADPRKGVASKATNFLSGARVSDISPAAQDAVLRDAASALGKSIGAKEFSRIVFTKDQIQQLAQVNPEVAKQAEAFNLLQKQLSNRQKNRRKQKEPVAKVTTGP